MASSTELLRRIDDITECSICSESFKEPKVLPCIHTFCLNCVAKYGKDKNHGDNMNCPLCRKVFIVPSGGFKELPNNYFIIQLLQINKSSSVEAAEKHIECEICLQMSEISKATTFCFDCSEHLCESCSGRHKVHKCLRMHKLIKIEDKPSAQELIKMAPSYCEQHPSKEIEFYCYDCKKILCVVCYVDKHNMHKCCDVKKSGEEFSIQLTEDINKVSASALGHQQKIKELEEEFSRASARVGTIQGDVLKKCHQLRSFIDQYQSQLIQEIKSFQEKHLKEFEIRKEELERQHLIIESFRRYCSELKVKGTLCDISRAGCDLHVRAVELVKSEEELSIAQLHSVEMMFRSSVASAHHISYWIGEIIFLQRKQGPADLFHNSNRNRSTGGGAGGSVDGQEAVSSHYVPPLFNFGAWKSADTMLVSTSSRAPVFEFGKTSAPIGAEEAADANKSSTTATRAFTLGALDDPSTRGKSANKDIIFSTMQPSTSVLGKPLSFWQLYGSSAAKSPSNSSVKTPVVTTATSADTQLFGEEKLFVESAKLYRMDRGQWKERGVGEIKIMRNPTIGRARIIMCREQALKLCANHSITAAMRLAPVASSKTSWCWTAQDYSEGEVHDEQLRVRFKSGESASKFKECFEQCQKELAIARKTDDFAPNVKVLQVAPARSTKPSMLKSLVSDGSMERKPSSTDVSLKSLLNEDSGKAAPTTETKPSLSELFKIPAGGWKCSSCYIKNVGNTAKCVACETPKVPAADTSSSADTRMVYTNTPALVFGFSKTSTPTFGDNNKPGTMAAPAFTLGAIDDASTTGKSALEGFKFSAMPRPTSVPGKPLFALSTTKTVVNKPKANHKPVALVSQLFGKDSKTAANLTMPTKTCSDNNPQFAFTPSFSFPKADYKPVAPISQWFGKDSKTAVDLTMPTKTSLDNKPQFAFTPSFSFPKTDTSRTLKNMQPSSFNFSLTIPSSVSETPATPPTTSSKSKSTGASMTKTPQSPTSPDDGLYQNSDEEGDHIHFEPIVKLPDNVVLVTGEEDEEALYEHRAKLYRFVDSQWKERGVGDVKILRHKGTDRGRLRVLMRREKLFKICLNHAITADMKLIPMGQDGNSLSFHAENVIDCELIHEILCLRFKNSAIASDYKKAFDSAVAEVKSTKSMSNSHGNAKDAGNSCNGAWRSSRVTADKKPESKDDDNANDDNDESCEILKVTLPSNDLIAKARQYLLPDTFYNYIQAPACPGCAGCIREEADYDDGDIKDIATELVKPTKTKAVFASAKFQLKPSSTDLIPEAHTLMSSTSSIASPFQKVEGIRLFQPKLLSAVTTGNKEEEDEQKEERSVFCKRAILFYMDGEKLLMKGIVGEIVIVPDSDVIGLRVRMLNDARELLCNHIICCEYKVKRTAKSCEWTAKDFRTDDPAHTSFRVTFSSGSAAKEFEQVFHEGLHQAHESDLSESKDD